MPALKFKNQRLYYLDQTQLPEKEIWQECKNIKDGYQAIKQLKVRGAPLIGVFSAYCVWLAAKQNEAKDKNKFLKDMLTVINYLKACRPTAVNLAWALARMQNVLKNQTQPISAQKGLLLKEAIAIHQQDIWLCEKIGRFGASLVKENDQILTHCNAGSLATSGQGTALAVIYQASRRYKNIRVYADETRPLLQGSRLTAWELMKNKVKVTLIADNMAGYLMQQKRINKIFVGADRIAANGDTANKIGTYSVAVLAKQHKIPFYVVAPFSTFDLTLSCGQQIPIEQRNADEVRYLLGKVWIAPRKVSVYNPAFDVTLAKYITAIITDKGIIKPPFNKNIKRLLTTI